MTTADDILLPTGKLMTIRNANLLLDQVDAAYFLGNGMLHLDPCIHFHEIVFSTGIQQKLNRSHTVIADTFCGTHGITKQMFTYIFL